MRIRWTGAKVVRRVIGAYEWSAATGFVQDVVEAELAVELVTSPVEQFVVDSAEPLGTLKGVGEQRAAELLLCGIATLNDVAALDSTGVQRVAAAINGSVQQVRAWVKQARQILEQSVEQEQEVAG